jgi:hypothetical protein
MRSSCSIWIRLTIFASELKMAFISRRAKLIPAYTWSPAPNAKWLIESQVISNCADPEICVHLGLRRHKTGPVGVELRAPKAGAYDFVGSYWCHATCDKSRQTGNNN